MRVSTAGFRFETLRVFQVLVFILALQDEVVANHPFFYRYNMVNPNLFIFLNIHNSINFGQLIRTIRYNATRRMTEPPPRFTEDNMQVSMYFSPTLQRTY